MSRAALYLFDALARPANAACTLRCDVLPTNQALHHLLQLGAHHTGERVAWLEARSALRRASYCDIYNEHLYDLLRWTQQPLAVRWGAARGFHVPDLAVRTCTRMADILQVEHGVQPILQSVYTGPQCVTCSVPCTAGGPV